MNKMTWLDLYKYLHNQANDINNLGKFDWNSPVMVHDASTGEEQYCDTWEISNESNQYKVVLVTNIDTIFAENK
jgi:hypothetical protein